MRVVTCKSIVLEECAQAVLEAVFPELLPKPFPFVVRLALDKAYGATYLSLKRKVMSITPAGIRPETTEALQVNSKGVRHSVLYCDAQPSIDGSRILVRRNSSSYRATTPA